MTIEFLLTACVIWRLLAAVCSLLTDETGREFAWGTRNPGWGTWLSFAV
jgi:hypothetical protein